MAPSSIERNRARGIAPDARAGAPRWRYDRDVPWAIEAAAREALDPVGAPDGPADEALDPPHEAPPPPKRALAPHAGGLGARQRAAARQSAVTAATEELQDAAAA